jgi:hypothetical protein
VAQELLGPESELLCCEPTALDRVGSHPNLPVERLMKEIPTGPTAKTDSGDRSRIKRARNSRGDGHAS